MVFHAMTLVRPSLGLKSSRTVREIMYSPRTENLCFHVLRHGGQEQGVEGKGREARRRKKRTRRGAGRGQELVGKIIHLKAQVHIQNFIKGMELDSG